MFIRALKALVVFSLVVGIFNFIDGYLSLSSTVDKSGGHNSGEGYYFVIQLNANAYQVDDIPFPKQCESELNANGWQNVRRSAQNAVSDMFKECLVEPIDLTTDLITGFCKSIDNKSCAGVKKLNQAAVGTYDSKSPLSCKQGFESLKVMCPESVAKFRNILGKPNTLGTPMIRTYYAD